MSAEGREFAEKWADENIKRNPDATDRDISVEVQRLLEAATAAGVPDAEVNEGIEGLAHFVAHRMGTTAPSANDPTG